jgi:hypothetical protein
MSDGSSGRRLAAAAASGVLILGDRQAKACWEYQILPNQLPICPSKVVSGFAHVGQSGMMRGSDVCGLQFHHAFIQEMEFLGNADLIINHFVHNEGKTNKKGWVQYKAFAPHVNPILNDLMILHILV